MSRLKSRMARFVGVIGRSGAGKSTLLRCINRLVDPSEGRIQFDGLDVTALRGKCAARLALPPAA